MKLSPIPADLISHHGIHHTQLLLPLQDPLILQMSGCTIPSSQDLSFHRGPTISPRTRHHHRYPRQLHQAGVPKPLQWQWKTNHGLRVAVLTFLVLEMGVIIRRMLGRISLQMIRRSRRGKERKGRMGNSTGLGRSVRVVKDRRKLRVRSERAGGAE